MWHVVFILLLAFLPASLRAERRVVELSSGQSYEILAKLGSGGYGSVYRARHVETGRYVAIKLFGDFEAYDREVVAPFRALEATDAREFLVTHHDEGLVVAVHAGPNNSLQSKVGGIVMDEVESDLERAVARFRLGTNEGKPEPWTPASFLRKADRVGDLAHQMLRLWTGINQAGVIHSDLKPDNLGFNDGPFSLRVLDDGSLVKGPLIKGSVVVQATEGFLAPETKLYWAGELPKGTTYNSYADLYSLASSLLFLVCEKCTPVEFRALLGRWARRLPRDEATRKAMAALWFASDFIEAGMHEKAKHRHQALKKPAFHSVLRFTPRETTFRTPHEDFLDEMPKVEASYRQIVEANPEAVWKRTEKAARAGPFELIGRACVGIVRIAAPGFRKPPSLKETIARSR